MLILLKCKYFKSNWEEAICRVILTRNQVKTVAYLINTHSFSQNKEIQWDYLDQQQSLAA